MIVSPVARMRDLARNATPGDRTTGKRSGGRHFVSEHHCLSSRACKTLTAMHKRMSRIVAYPHEHGIAAPLIDLQHGCNAAIQPMQIAALYQAPSIGPM